MNGNSDIFSKVMTVLLTTGVTTQSAIVTAQAQSGGGLEEIVVTAQRREQSLQEVPISVETISGTDVLNNGFKNMEQLSKFVPGFIIDAPSDNSQSVTVRGIGTSSNNWAIEQSVPIFVDGVHYGRGSSSFNAFLDVERVEVLRGPQPIFFGQNAAAGAVSVISRKPGDVWEGYVNGEVGNNNIINSEFGVGGPVNDTVGIRFAGKYDTTEGFVTDVLKGDKYPAGESYAGRSTLSWTPTEALNVIVKFDFADVERESDPIAYVDVYPDARNTLGAAITGNVTAIPGMADIVARGDGIDDLGLERSGPWQKLPLTVFEGFGATPTSMADLSYLGNTCQLPVRTCKIPFSDLELYSSYLQADYTFSNDIILSSQTSYTYLDRYFVRDGSTAGPWLVNIFDRAEKQDQISQEFRLTSPGGGMLEWMAGLYWEQINLNTEGTGYRAAVSNVSPTQGIQGNQHGEDDKWLSAFSAATVNLMDNKVSVDLGLRYTDIQKDGYVIGRRAFWTDINGTNIVGPAMHGTTAYGATPLNYYTARTVAEWEDSKVDYQAVLRWRPYDEMSLYAKYSTGLKAGGFDAGTTQVKTLSTFIYESEKAENWELGVKGSFLERRVSYNLTLYRSEFEGLQVAALNPLLGESVTANVGAQRNQGAEFSLQYAATDRWTLGLSGSLMDALITSFPGATCTQNEINQGVCGRGGIAGRIDRSGQNGLYAPDWNLTLRTGYWLPIMDNYKATFNAMLLISDGYLTGFDQAFVMKQHEDLNLSLALGTIDEKWSISLWSRNMLEALPTYQPEHNFGTIYQSTGLSQRQFMTYGAGLSYKF